MLFAAAAAANAQKVYIDYDNQADLTKYKTFAMATAGQDDLSKTSPLAHQHILDSLRQKLTSSGKFTETKDNPDLYVTYHVTSKEETNVSTMPTGYGYGYGAGLGWGLLLWRRRLGGLHHHRQHLHGGDALLRHL